MSHAPHRIALRRPWICQAGADGICWTRRFGRPTSLSADERVWLLLEGLPEGVVAWLNGRPIPIGRVDVTPLLHARNELRLEIPPASAPVTDPSDAPPGRTILEICPLDSDPSD